MGQSAMTGEALPRGDSADISIQGANGNSPRYELPAFNATKSALTTSGLDENIRRGDESRHENPTLAWQRENDANAQMELVEYTDPAVTPATIQIVLDEGNANSQITFLNIKEPMPYQIPEEELPILYKIAAMSRTLPEDSNMAEVQESRTDRLPEAVGKPVSENGSGLRLEEITSQTENLANTDLSLIFADRDFQASATATKELIVLRKNEFFSERSSLESNASLTSEVDTTSKDTYPESAAENVTGKQEVGSEVGFQGAPTKKVNGGERAEPRIEELPCECVEEDALQKKSQTRQVKNVPAAKGSPKSRSPRPPQRTDTREMTEKTGAKTCEIGYQTLRRGFAGKKPDVSIVVVRNGTSTLLTTRSQRASKAAKGRSGEWEAPRKTRRRENFGQPTEGVPGATSTVNEESAAGSTTASNRISEREFGKTGNGNSPADEAPRTTRGKLRLLEKQTASLRRKLDESEERSRKHEKNAVTLMATLRDVRDKLSCTINEFRHEKYGARSPDSVTRKSTYFRA